MIRWLLHDWVEQKVVASEIEAENALVAKLSHLLTIKKEKIDKQSK